MGHISSREYAALIVAPAIRCFNSFPRLFLWKYHTHDTGNHKNNEIHIACFLVS